jgi:hypothetical protein
MQTDNPHMSPESRPWLVHMQLDLSFLQPIAMGYRLQSSPASSHICPAPSPETLVTYAG